jgi:hypothetical protein
MLQVRFVVMGNVFPTEVRLHRKYDLKGSTHGRTAGARKYTEPDIILKVRLRVFLCRTTGGNLLYLLSISCMPDLQMCSHS